jgi:general secretion pathway protein A
MFEQFYGFSAPPFQLTPDQRFFYQSRGHGRAISHLIFGLSQGEGFIVITGEVGAGKTTLVERLWAQLDREAYMMARVSTTQVSGDDLFRLAMAGFGVTAQTSDKATLIAHFEEILRVRRAEGKRLLLVVDEAQNLSLPALEELRMLSNLSEEGQAGLQTILLGQPQFRARIASPDLEQLRSRVLASYHLGPLAEEETRAYIEHRLKAVDWNGDPSFTEAAFAAIHRESGGVPRRINRLVSRVMLYGALEEAHTITGPMVNSTAEELQRDLEGGAPVYPVVPPSHAPAAVASAPAGKPGLAELAGRVAALEEASARRERVFQRLLDVFGGIGTRG